MCEDYRRLEASQAAPSYAERTGEEWPQRIGSLSAQREPCEKADEKRGRVGAGGASYDNHASNARGDWVGG